MQLFWNNFDEMGLEFAKTQFGIVLEFSRGDAIGIRLRHNLNFPYHIFDRMRLEFG